MVFSARSKRCAMSVAFFSLDDGREQHVRTWSAISLMIEA